MDQFKRVLARNAPAESGADFADAPAPPTSADDPSNAVANAYWLLLWRAGSDDDLAGAQRALNAGQTLPELLARLLGSAECRAIVEATWDGLDVGRDIRATEAAFRTLGDERQFVARTYQSLLGRDADASGLSYYAEQIGGGLWRTSFVQVLLRSEEFRDRYTTLCPQSGLIPVDSQLCELANPAKWSNPEWMALMRSLVLVPTDRPSMHRKGYELTQLLFGLTRLGVVRDDVHVVSVGAGHEPVLYWLANHVGKMVATDLYKGAWQAVGSMEGDAVVLADPDQYAPFPYRRERLDFLRMDGTRLEFTDASFDVAYSLSSIEHFGGVEGARRAIAEMARVLRPGGILALATEYCLSGPPHHEAFQPAEVHALLDHPGLELVAPIDELVWRRYDYRAVDLRVNRHQTPQLVVQDLGTEFTSVMVFLRKRAS